MSAYWEYLITLYHCGARGVAPPEPPEETDWAELALLAERQAVTPVVFNALRKEGAMPAQLRQTMHMKALELSLQNRRHQEAALDVLQKMREAGIPAAVLKGMSVARYFASPETRICADTDVLIAPEQENAAAALLGRLGFSVEPREKTMHHFRASHPTAGLFEVHVRLWDSESALAFGACEYSLEAAALQEVSLYGNPFFVLPQAEDLQFLCLHRIKHFLQREEGLRSAYDAALFFAENRKAIRPEAFWSGLRRWNADLYFNILLSVLVRAGCFREEDFPGMTLQDEAACRRFSSDMERYSYETPTPPLAEREAWLRYSRTQAESLGGSVKERYDKQRRKRLRALLLPSAESLSVHYPALKKCRLLYPVFWLHRCVTGLLSKRRRKALRHLRPEWKPLAARKPEAGSRTALMQELGLFRE